MWRTVLCGLYAPRGVNTSEYEEEQGEQITFEAGDCGRGLVSPKSHCQFAEMPGRRKLSRTRKSK